MGRKVTVIVEGREYIVEVGDLSESPIKATVNNRTYQVETPRQSTPPAQSQATPVEAAPTQATVEQAPTSPVTRSESKGPAITAPMPGNITEVKVKAGDRVQPGDVICVLEAMKMNNMIYADQAGTIASVEVIAGQAVDYDALLVTFE